MTDLLRPEQMSKVSVTGSKAVMEDVVDAVHDQHCLHVTEYDGSWDGFEPGDPVEGADELSEKLVTVRSLESILDVDDEDAGPTRLVTDEAIETELEEIRQRVNELDDRREAIRDDLREVEDRIDTMAPFADLGIDLDLLQGYDSLQVAVGEGSEAAVRAALEDAEEVATFELFTGDGVVAAFARPAEDAPEDALEEALVGVDFAAIEVPDLEAGPVDVDEPTPETYLEALESRRDQLASKLDTVENELEDEKLETAGFLLAVEEKLAIEVQKHEAPLSFATTEHSFVAEGWLPTEEYDAFAATVEEAVDGRVEVEEIERASYDGHGHPTATEQVGEGGAPAAAADGGTAADSGASDDARADGGGVVTVQDDPPVVLDNPGAIRPIELLVETVGRPSYDEFDPTWLLFLTFPAFFGYMIGDVGYGLGYAAVGYLLMTKVDSEGIQKLGGVGVWCGAFTILFGVLYGEFLGLHLFGKIVWPSGHPPLEKGLGAPEFAKAWMLVTLFVGLLHVTLGHALSFVKEMEHHGTSTAVFESGSWIVLMVGVWGAILSVLPSLSPELFTSTLGADGAIPVGFTGLPSVLAYPMVAVIAVGFVMLVIGEGIQAVEVLQVLVNVLSYMRLMAVLLAKAGMAFVVNLFVFGLYEDKEGALHFVTTSGHHVEESKIVFEGLLNMGIGPAIGGILVLVVGHLIVFALGITSAGLQALRLEYVEFFGKFYDGEGRTYNPFGYRREYTTED